MRSPRSPRAAGVLVIALLLSACGGDSERAAEQSGPSASGSPSATPAGTPAPEPSPEPSGRSVVSVYFLLGEKVQPVQRVVDAPAVGAGAIRALLAGPSSAERGAGLSSSVPSGTDLLGLTIADGQATVDLSARYASGGGSLSMLTRLAQVVYTLTAFPSVDDVAFRLDGEPVEVFGGEGVVLDGPVDRADFEDQAPAVLIEAPALNATVGSPLRVTGSANVFEAVFHLELIDADGTVLVTRQVTASSGTGTRGTFDATLTFTAPAGTGRLVAFVYSARDGAREDIVSIPITFAESGK